MIRKMKETQKRGQEEIVGFVLIMVIVAVVFLVFLGIMLRKGSTDAVESVDAYQFLESTMEYTTDCAIRFVPDYSRTDELIEECYSGSRCIDGRDSCDVLKSTLSDLIASSWNVGNESAIKGYKFSAVYSSSAAEASGEEIVSLDEGNCEERIRGASYLIPSFPGTIKAIFQICF